MGAIWFTLWMVYLVVSCVPGFLLWALTLGSFRYFHLSSLMCDYLVDKAIKNA